MKHGTRQTKQTSGLLRKLSKLYNFCLYCICTSLTLINDLLAPSLQTDGGLRSECLWNIMRLTLDEALAVGSQLEIAAISE